MGLGDSLACFGGAGHLLSRRRQKAGERQQAQMTLSKRQDSPCENRANGHGTVTRREYANHTRPRERRMKAESRFLRHFAARHGTPCGRNPPPRQPREGMACKRTNEVCTRTDSIQSGKSLPKPCFSPLSAHAGTALRQKSFVFAEGGSFLCGRRLCFYREKTSAGTEKCSIQTVSPPGF